MLTLLAHGGPPPAPGDAWNAWNLDPVLLAGLLLAVWLFVRGQPRDAARTTAFVGGVAALVVALVSPLEPISGALASAHMVQHILILAVAAPLLAFSAPATTMLRGAPRRLVRAGAHLGRAVGLRPRRLRLLRNPAVVWLLNVGVLWSWHASVLYEAALRSQALHILQHLTFLFSGILVWRVVVGPRRVRVVPGAGVIIVFALAMQNVLLSALLTFSQEPWYGPYAETAPLWGLSHLGDQQLSGVIMWVPTGLIYVAIAMHLLRSWLEQADLEGRERPVVGRRGA